MSPQTTTYCWSLTFFIRFIGGGHEWDPTRIVVVGGYLKPKMYNNQYFYEEKEKKERHERIEMKLREAYCSNMKKSKKTKHKFKDIDADSISDADFEIRQGLAKYVKEHFDNVNLLDELTTAAANLEASVKQNKLKGMELKRQVVVNFLDENKLTLKKVMGKKDYQKQVESAKEYAVKARVLSHENRRQMKKTRDAMSRTIKSVNF